MGKLNIYQLNAAASIATHMKSKYQSDFRLNILDWGSNIQVQNSRWAQLLTGAASVGANIALLVGDFQEHDAAAPITKQYSGGAGKIAGEIAADRAKDNAGDLTEKIGEEGNYISRGGNVIAKLVIRCVKRFCKNLISFDTISKIVGEVIKVFWADLGTIPENAKKLFDNAIIIREFARHVDMVKAAHDPSSEVLIRDGLPKTIVTAIEGMIHASYGKAIAGTVIRSTQIIVAVVSQFLSTGVYKLVNGIMKILYACYKIVLRTFEYNAINSFVRWCQAELNHFRSLGDASMLMDRASGSTELRREVISRESR